MNPVNRMLSAENIADLEERYNAKYLFDTCLKCLDGSWANYPGAVFYTEEAHPEGSNYFALYWDNMGESLYITDAFSSIQGEFLGFLFEDGELLHSRFRHDYMTYREAMVDGGRDYFRASECPPEARPVTFSVLDGRLVEASKS